MPGLLLIATETAGARFRAGVELAATVAAAGRPVRVLVKGAAVGGLCRRPEDFALLFELGAEVIACQTDMAAAGLPAAALPPGTEAAGLLHALRDSGDWQLLLV